MARVFVTRLFARFSKGERIGDGELLEAIDRAERGLIDADLGGGVIKQRIARPGSGRSGGYRTLVAFRSEGRAVYLYGFAKNDRSNIDAKELVALRKLAESLLASSDSSIAEATADGSLREIRREEEHER